MSSADSTNNGEGAVHVARPTPLTKTLRRTIHLAPMGGKPPQYEVDQDVQLASWDGGKTWVLQSIADRGPVRCISE